MSVPAVWPQVLDFFGTPLVIEPSPGQLSSDAGLLPIRQFDQRIGLTWAFAEALDDPRDPDLTEPPGREFAEFVVNQRQELLGGVRVALLDGGQDAGDLAHRRHQKGEGPVGMTSPDRGAWPGVFALRTRRSG